MLLEGHWPLVSASRHRSRLRPRDRHKDHRASKWRAFPRYRKESKTSAADALTTIHDFRLGVMQLYSVGKPNPAYGASHHQSRDHFDCRALFLSEVQQGHICNHARPTSRFGLRGSRTETSQLFSSEPLRQDNRIRREETLQVSNLGGIADIFHSSMHSVSEESPTLAHCCQTAISITSAELTYKSSDQRLCEAEQSTAKQRHGCHPNRTSAKSTTRSWATALCFSSPNIRPETSSASSEDNRNSMKLRGRSFLSSDKGTGECATRHHA